MKIGDFQKRKIHSSGLWGFMITAFHSVHRWHCFHVKICNIEKKLASTLPFLKHLIFLFFDKRGQECSCMFIYGMLSGIPIGLLHEIANDVFFYFRECNLSFEGKFVKVCTLKTQ